MTFPGIFVGKTVSYRTSINKNLLSEEGVLVDIHRNEYRVHLEIDKGGRTVYVNFDHIVSIEEKDQ